MNPPHDTSKRLDSWKVIAAYLGRDVRTIRRWERAQGLPIRRIPGRRGRSVFAYAAEIDDWLRSGPAEARPGQSAAGAATSAPAATVTNRTLARRPRMWIALAAGIVVVATIGWWRPWERRVNISDLRLRLTPDGVVASLPDGALRWRYDFASEYSWSVLNMTALIAMRAPAAVYVATTVGERRSDGQLVGGVLTSLSANGAADHAFSFDDTVAFQDGTFGPPWAITSYAVSDPADGARRIAVAAHHYVWGASVVTVLDERWRRRGTYVNFGWIQSVRWLTPSRLLISGFSNAHDAAMVALLDPTGPDGVRGQGPEAPGSAGHCQACGSATAIRVVIMPRSPLNRATASPFNSAVLELDDGRVIVRTLEVPSGGPRVVDAVYEFSSSLDLLRASYSDSYREMRQALVARGTLHARDTTTAEDDHPGAVQVWDAANGWRTIDARNRPFNRSHSR